MQQLSPRQLASIHRGDLTDYTVEARDGRVGRLSEATAAVAEGTLVVELGTLLFGELVLVPLAAVREVDAETETLVLTLSRQEVQTAPRFLRTEESN